MEIIAVCFAQAVRLPNHKNETFVAADAHTSIDWDSKLSAVVIKMKDIQKEVLVFSTNIAYLVKAESKK
jgi:hypothetical protein